MCPGKELPKHRITVIKSTEAEACQPAGCRGSDLEQSDWEEEQWVTLELRDQGPGGHYTNSGCPLRQEVTQTPHLKDLLSVSSSVTGPYKFFLVC